MLSNHCDAAQMCMMWVPLAEPLVESDLLTGERYGERFARIVRHWKREGDV